MAALEVVLLPIGQARVLQSVHIPRMAQVIRHGPTSDSLVPHGRKLLDGLAAVGEVVAAHNAHVWIVQPAVHQHDWRAQSIHLLDLFHEFRSEPPCPPAVRGEAVHQTQVVEHGSKGAIAGNQFPNDARMMIQQFMLDVWQKRRKEATGGYRLLQGRRKRHAHGPGARPPAGSATGHPRSPARRGLQDARIRQIANGARHGLIRHARGLRPIAHRGQPLPALPRTGCYAADDVVANLLVRTLPTLPLKRNRANPAGIVQGHESNDLPKIRII